MLKTNEVLAPQSGGRNFTDIFLGGGGHKLAARRPIQTSANFEALYIFTGLRHQTFKLGNVSNLKALFTAGVGGATRSSRSRLFDVSRAELLSHTTNLNAFVLTPAVPIYRDRALKEGEYQLPVAIFDVRDVNILVS